MFNEEAGDSSAVLPNTFERFFFLFPNILGVKTNYSHLLDFSITST
jgi:hypothetical protein